MMQWPIEAAHASGLFDMIVVSTDDDEIQSVALALGAVVVRRRVKDDGSRGTQEIAADVLRQFPSATAVCTIYPCSPLLNAWTLTDAHEFWPGWAPLVSTYDGEPRDAGCFYFQQAHELLDETQHLWRCATLTYPLPPERCIDINTPEDWSRAESMFDALTL
jgi:pseudaminic acid cytidylyltransferase